jgi:uncharacterized protein
VTYLLDVNVLIALIDPAHISHDLAHRWFADEGGESWATSPIAENGVIRIVGHPGYANTPGSPSIVAGVLGRLRQRHGHVFWLDDISLLDPACVETGRLLSHRQVTDSYLLALAVAHAGKLASFDRRLTPASVPGGQGSLHLIGV